jgi:hypothetical protein
VIERTFHLKNKTLNLIEAKIRNKSAKSEEIDFMRKNHANKFKGHRQSVYYVIFY